MSNTGTNIMQETEKVSMKLSSIYVSIINGKDGLR